MACEESSTPSVTLVVEELEIAPKARIAWNQSRWLGWMYAIHWGRGAYLLQVSSLVIPDNALQENVAGVHETKSINGMNSSSLSIIRTEGIDRMDATVWFHHTYVLFGSPLVGNCHCASERSIIVEAYEEFWMGSRSNDGRVFLDCITT